MAVKYLQMEPAAYPADPDWLAMTAEERGCYHTLIVFLGCNGGKLENNTEKLRNLCGATNEKFEIFWKKFSHKFPVKRGMITHKRVSRELARSRKLIKQRQLAGKKSGESRRTLVEQPLNGNGTKAQLSEVKRSKVKISKKREVFIPPTLKDVKSYCLEKGLTIKPEHVWSFYENKGWKVGKVVMKDWHLAVSRSEDWENAPRVKRQPTPKDEIAALEKKRQEMRAEHGQFIREADEKKLITVWRTQITLRPLINELRPEIAGKAK